MAIKRIHCNLMDYEVGQDSVTSIEPPNQGSKNNTMYKVTFEDRDILFVGMLEHEVEYVEEMEQTTMFEFI